MARKKTARRRRGPSATSLISLGESYLLANELTQAGMKMSPVGFIFGSDDMRPSMNSAATYVNAGVANGGGQVSLREFIAHPGIALAAVQDNLKEPGTFVDLFINTMLISGGARLAKRALRRPISNINRNVFKPLGMGVKL